MKKLSLLHSPVQNCVTTGTADAHIFKRILDSQARPMVLLRKVMAVLVLVLAAAHLRVVLQSLAGPYLYLRDIVQEYLMAKAILVGMDPYLPLPELFAEFIGPLPTPILPHSTPHPPAAALLGLILSGFSYVGAVQAWLVIEIVLIFVAAFLFLVWMGQRPTFLSTLLCGGAFLAWRPFLEELLPGQLMILLLVLLLGAGIAFQSHKPLLGGCLLGCTMALKLITWPVVLFLVLKRKWGAVIAAGATAAFVNLAVGAWAGFDTLLRYYFEVGSSVLPLYRYQAYNFSIQSVGWRLFEGTFSQVIIIMDAHPLIYSPLLARLVAYGLSLGVVGLGLWGAMRAPKFELGFAMALCVSLLVSPVVWSHYFVLLLIPFGALWYCLSCLGLPRRWTNGALVLAVLFSIPNNEWIKLIYWLAGQPFDRAVSALLPLHVVLLTFVPTLAIIGLLWLLWKLSELTCTRCEICEEAQAS